MNKQELRNRLPDKFQFNAIEKSHPHYQQLRSTLNELFSKTVGVIVYQTIYILVMVGII